MSWERWAAVLAALAGYVLDRVVLHRALRRFLGLLERVAAALEADAPTGPEKNSGASEG